MLEHLPLRNLGSGSPNWGSCSFLRAVLQLLCGGEGLQLPLLSFLGPSALVLYIMLFQASYECGVGTDVQAWLQRSLQRWFLCPTSQVSPGANGKEGRAAMLHFCWPLVTFCDGFLCVFASSAFRTECGEEKHLQLGCEVGGRWRTGCGFLSWQLLHAVQVIRSCRMESPGLDPHCQQSHICGPPHPWDGDPQPRWCLTALQENQLL